MKSTMISRLLRAAARSIVPMKHPDKRTDIRNVLARDVDIGAQISIAGWLRSLRVSKGGFAFLSVNDGSCFDSLQVVAAGALSNYESEIVKLTTGCAVEVRGTI